MQNPFRMMRSSQPWPLLTLLGVLFFGPLLAPLLQATGLPALADSGALARDVLSRYVCPTPAKSYALLGFPMAVCARCWGATIGLWGAWFLFRRLQIGLYTSTMVSAYVSLPALLRLSVAIGALLLWTLEINLWPGAPLPALILNGANGGFWAGMFLLFFATRPTPGALPGRA
jgi:hypothetical protein